MGHAKRWIKMLPIGGFLTLLLFAQGCGQKAAEQEKINTPKVASLETSVSFKPLKPVGPVEGSPTFEKFLNHFQVGIPWQEWADRSRHTTAFGGHAFGKLNLLKQDLQRDHIPIPSAYLRFFKLDFLLEPCKPWYAYTYKHSKPAMEFEFYGFAKEQLGSFWLVSCIALNVKAIEGDYKHEAFLSTFQTDGTPIDNYIWWGIEDGEIEAMGDVLMAHDTILEGNNRHGEEGDPLITINRKILIDPTGHFQIVQEYVPNPDSKSDMDPKVWPCR